MWYFISTIFKLAQSVGEILVNIGIITQPFSDIAIGKMVSCISEFVYVRLLKQIYHFYYLTNTSAYIMISKHVCFMNVNN